MFGHKKEVQRLRDEITRLNGVFATDEYVRNQARRQIEMDNWFHRIAPVVADLECKDWRKRWNTSVELGVMFYGVCPSATMNALVKLRETIDAQPPKGKKKGKKK